MFEVEAKVAISREEYESLLTKLKEKSRPTSREITDTYYDNPKNAFIRIRRRGGDYDFNLKRRETKKGIESNIEMEWGIKDPESWKKWLKKLSISPAIQKSKKSKIFKMGNYTIELNYISKLGYYLEIERMVAGKGELAKAKRELVNLFNKLGYREKQFEARPYLELLSYV